MYNCVICGKEYSTFGHHHKYCNDCKKKQYWAVKKGVIVNCAFCGIKLRRKSGVVKKHPLSFCCHSHRAQYIMAEKFPDRVIWKDKTFNEYRKEWRHKKGISKKFNTGIRIPRSYYSKIYRCRKVKAGKLSIQVIQKIYEENIKNFGTLTCIYCLNPIEFGQDSLEHKHPLSKGGTNDYANLGVACRKCNTKKNAKTEEQYRKEILR